MYYKYDDRLGQIFSSIPGAQDALWVPKAPWVRDRQSFLISYGTSGMHRFWHKNCALGDGALA